jgi:hypothetical protein
MAISWLSWMTSQINYRECQFDGSYVEGVKSIAVLLILASTVRDCASERILVTVKYVGDASQFYNGDTTPGGRVTFLGWNC